MTLLRRRPGGVIPLHPKLDFRGGLVCYSLPSGIAIGKARPKELLSRENP